jgi:subtilisin family serine protease
MLTAALSRIRARLAIAGTLALALTLAPALAVTGEAHADIVRSDQAWVLDAVAASAAWRITMGQGVTVAVIDSGVDPDVSDLQGSVTTGPDYTGVGTPPANSNWGVHGTWMASLVAGHGHGLGSGVLGTAPRSHVLSIRVITDRADPGFAAYQREPLSRGQRELAKAISYAVAQHASVISMSLGYNMASRLVRSALQDAINHGVVVVASSGNSGDAADAHGEGQAPYSFPADYPGVLGVGAVNQAGQPASFSSANLSVQVAAPGVNVPAQGRDGQYWLVSGTSPACALTAGVAALIKSRYPRLSPALVGEAIISTTRNRPPGGYDDQVGFGTVDAADALTAAAHLARQGSGGHGASASGFFGGGPATVSAAPVKRRGPGALILLILLGAGCLAIVVTATWRLVTVRSEPQADEVPGGGPALAAAGRPDAYPAQDNPAERGQEAERPPALARFPWQSASAGRHVAPPDRGGEAEAAE